MSVNQICDNLWLGNLEAANTLQDSLTLTHMLSVGAYPTTVNPKIKQMKIDIEDREDEDLIKHVFEAVKFIKEALESQGTILVHC